MVDIEERRTRRKGTTFLLVVAAIAFLLAAFTRLLGIDGGRYMVATTALTPYFTAAGVLLGALALLLRRWAVGTVTLLVAVVLVAAVAPRAFPDSRPVGVGREVTVMAANLLVGKAEAEAVVAAVRAHDVDVLTQQELTPAMVRDFERAGLDDVLPYRHFLDEPGGSGSGIASRYPVFPRTLTPPSTLRQAGALVDLPGAEDLEVLSVHPLPPVVDEGPRNWQRDLAGLPRRALDGPVRVLAGIEALAALNEGRVEITPERIAIAGSVAVGVTGLSTVTGPYDPAMISDPLRPGPAATGHSTASNCRSHFLTRARKPWKRSRKVK